MLHDLAAPIMIGVLVLAIVLAVRDLRRQTTPTDPWNHLTYRPAPRRRRTRRERRHAIDRMMRDAHRPTDCP
ncbi:hypothetical protein [Actinomadura geliboluensis]|uniref:hypothetical protein n=1 Tax=Actinomadura geliboluensis TaxID=882440 RepID=UPI0026079011|nr:hypothetical protein [Actinomadura geliboluensis]